MGFTFQQVKDVRVVRWTCDVYGCREAEDVPDDGTIAWSLLAPDWSAVLVTSMTDDDYDYIQCRTHTRHLHRRFSDGVDHSVNAQATGR
jgi:hypothetical protein